MTDDERNLDRMVEQARDRDTERFHGDGESRSNRTWGDLPKREPIPDAIRFALLLADLAESEAFAGFIAARIGPGETPSAEVHVTHKLFCTLYPDRDSWSFRELTPGCVQRFVDYGERVRVFSIGPNNYGVYGDDS